MATSAQVECRHCGRMCTLMILRRDHGPGKPKCVSHKWETWLMENNWRNAGGYSALLCEAGIAKQIPLYCWWRVWLDANGEEVHRRSKLSVTTELREFSSFTACVPQWAYDLAHQVSRDRQLARKLGFTKKRKLTWRRSPNQGSSGFPKSKNDDVRKEKVWVDCDEDKVLPMHLRVRIMRVAGNNSLAREMIMDDPEAAGRIIMDVL